MYDLIAAVMGVILIICACVAPVRLWLKPFPARKALGIAAVQSIVIVLMIMGITYVSLALTRPSMDMDVRDFYDQYWSVPLWVACISMICTAGIAVLKCRRISK